MNRQISTLFVAMNGTWVGTLTREKRGLAFNYDAQWLSGPAIPLSSSLPLSTQPHTSENVAHYFNNLLPDSAEVRDQLRRMLGAASVQPFDLLAIVGGDCIGALQLLTSRELPESKIRGTPISDTEIASILKRPAQAPLGHVSADDDFRISVAGAQQKTALLRMNGEWYRPEGSTPTTHILKPPIALSRWDHMSLHDSVENAWLCLEICREFGLPTAEAEMQTFEDITALIVTRFDRRWQGSSILRLPQEDGCQALGISSDSKYESDGGPNIAQIMDHLQAASIKPAYDRVVFFRALVLYWLLAATDGHAKNFSFALRPHGRIRLAPLYDVLSVFPVVRRGQLPLRKIKMAMAVTGTKSRKYRWGEIFPRHWLLTAERCGLPSGLAQKILDDYAAQTKDVIEAVKKRLPADFPDSVAEPIFEGLLRGVSRL